MNRAVVVVSLAGLLVFVLLAEAQTGNVVKALNTFALDDADLGDNPAPAPQSQEMRRSCQNQALVGGPTISINSPVSISSPANSRGALGEYFAAYSNVRRQRPHVFGLGATGMPGGWTGDREISYPSSYGIYPPIASFGDTMVYQMSSALEAYIIAQSAGVDGIVGTTDDPRSVAVKDYRSWALIRRAAPSQGPLSNDIDLASSGALYLLSDSLSGATLLIRQDSGADRVLQFPYLYPNSDDLIEVAQPSAASASYLQTSSTKTSSWVDYRAAGIVTNVIDPGSDNFFNGAPPTGDDILLTIGGQGVDSWKSRLSYDGERLVTVMTYPSQCTPSSPTGCNFWVDVWQFQNGRLSAPTSVQTLLLPVPRGTTPDIVGADIDGSYTSPIGRIKSSLVAAYFTPDQAGSYTVLNLLYINTGLNGAYFDSDDFISYYQQSGMSTSSLRDVVVKENKIALVTGISGQQSISYLIC